MSVKSGTSPEVLRLPKGGGSITAISEGFTPDLKSGTGNYRIPIEVPAGRVPLPVELELTYSTGFGNGPFGLGWNLTGIPAIQRRVDNGIPSYTNADRLELTTVGELARVDADRYRALVEDGFSTINRTGDVFEMWDREGRLYRFGESSAERVADPDDPQRIFRWLVSSIEDLNGNRMEYKYRRDDIARAHLDGPASQVYLAEILFNNLPDGTFLYRLILEYDFDGPGQQRPDPVLSNRAGFPLETNWRCRSIEVKLGSDIEDVIQFGALPDGTPITEFTPLQGNEFEPDGVLIELDTPSATDQPAIFHTGLGATTPILGVAAGYGFGFSDLAFSLTNPAQSVTLVFYGASVPYTLRAYDELDRLIAQAQADGVLFGGAQEIQVETQTASIYRLEFGSDTAAFGIAEIQLLRQAAPLCRRYELNYDDAGPGRLSLLESIQLVGENPDGRRISRPPITFGYSVPDETNRTLRPITGAPSVSLGRDDYEVVDLVGTGTPDILYTPAANDHRYLLNRGDGTMAAQANMPAAPSATLADLHTRLGDVKGLVAADLFTQQHVYPSPSIRPDRALNDPVEWGAQENLSNFPAFADSQMPEVRFLDLTGDGRVDILRTAGRFLMWFQQPDHSFIAQPPIDRISSYFDTEWPNVSFADPRIKLADMTGDGFMDIVRVDSLAARVEYWPNKGLGHWGKKRLMFFDGSGLSYPLNLQRIFFADIDNNGFADLIYVASSEVFIWPNQGGKAFGTRQRIVGTPLVGSGQLDSVRLLDMTGVGTLGVLWTRDGAASEDTFQFMNLTGDVKPHLLTRVENGMGGVTEVEYASSSALYHADERAGQGWDATAPFAVHVVSKISRTDTITGVREETTYKYRTGYYDREKRKFHGFGQVSLIYKGDGTPSCEVRGAVEVHHFQQKKLETFTDAQQKAHARALAGREYLVEHFDEDGTTLLKWTRTDWKVVPVYLWQNGAPVAAETDQDDNTPVLFPYTQGRLEGTEEGTTELMMKYDHESRSLPNPLDTVPPEIAASHGQVLERRLYGEVVLRPAGDTASATVTTVRRNGNDVEVIDVPQDTRLITREYAVNEAANLIRIAAQITRDAGGAIVVERHYFYDGPDFQGLPAGQVSRGNITRQSDLVLREDSLATLYAGSPYTADWAVLGYHTQALADSSGDGLFVHTQRYRYGEFGLPDGILSPMGQETKLYYDLQKTRLQRTTNPLNQSVTVSYDNRVGLLTTYTDENDQIWRYIFDGLGRTITEIEPGDTEVLPTRSYEYYYYEALSFNRPVAIVKHERETQGQNSIFSTHNYYDGFLRDLQVRKPWRTTQYQVSSRSYNPRGELAQETLPYLDTGTGYNPPGSNLPTRYFAYDALLRNSRTTQPNSAERLIDRTPWTNTVFDEEDTAAGSPHYDTPSTFQFNAEENIIKVDRRLGTRTLSYQFDYDLLGDLIHVVDPAANEVHWSFDTRGLLLKIVHPDAGTILHYYDAVGQEKARVYANGDLIEFTYDELKRVKTRRLGGATPRTETFAYDTGEGSHLVGRVAEVQDAAGTIVYGYDERGRQVWQKRTFSDQPAQAYITTLTYDPMGRLRSIDYPDGASTVYRYGLHGKVERIDGLLTRILYHPSGQPAQFDYVGGANQVITYGPVTHWISSRLVTADGLTLHDLTYNYDMIGNVTTLTDAATAPGHLTMSRTYVYDDLYRLRRFTSTQGHDESYDYDDIGNITLHTGYSVNALIYPATGQTSTLLGAQGEIPWQYDSNGRLTKGAGFDQLQWDAAQNLNKAVEPGGTHKFVYSREGDLIEHIHTDVTGAGDIVRLPNKHFSAYPGQTLRRIYLDDILVAVVRQMGGKETISFTITNELGHVVGFVDETGAFNQIEYAPYGKRLYQTQPDVNYGFSGKEEIAPDLLAFDYRSLLTSIGRWNQPDPLILSRNNDITTRPERLNPYAYAGNNPVNRVDPSGLADIEKTNSSKEEEQPHTPTEEVVEKTIEHGVTEILKTLLEGLSKMGGGAVAGTVVTVVQGLEVGVKGMDLSTRRVRELAEADARSRGQGFVPVQGTNQYISPGRRQLLEMNNKLSSGEYGTVGPVEGKLKVVWQGQMYFHQESNTVYWRDEGDKWQSYSYESPKVEILKAE